MSRRARVEELHWRARRLREPFEPLPTIDLRHVPTSVAELYVDILQRAELNVLALSDEDLEYFEVIEQLARVEPSQLHYVRPAWQNEYWPLALCNAYRDRFPEARSIEDSLLERNTEQSTA